MSKSVFYSYSISNSHRILNSKIHPFHSINISYNTERKLKRTHIFPPSPKHTFQTPTLNDIPLPLLLYRSSVFQKIDRKL